MFAAAVSMGATVIRSHTLGFSSGNANALQPTTTTINASAWTAIDYVFYKATQTGIKLICPLTDCYNYYHGNYGDYPANRGVQKTNFFTNATLTADFKQFISTWLNHVNTYTGVAIKNSPALFAIETGNEFNIRPDVTSTTYPPASWLSDISAYIKTMDSKHFILDGTDENFGNSNDFAISTLDM
ncbi:putative Mannan endo-1,4-beta-mannosidase 2 [Hypsibius exemplaris]|uniref:mannan endo-1,4-beta-mannosidase n=1 Tax=Hypsibius exemplaris TaxID=2072580 RepID=A0A1W0WWP1_HYPEX|nr:putative Mannan endo-1,4-beta-mannosidase 2 [Hypsibius exemplaris]